LSITVKILTPIIKDEYKKSYEGELEQAAAALQSAVDLKEVDIKRSREMFITGRRILTELQDREIKDEEIDKLSALAVENEKEILGERKKV